MSIAALFYMATLACFTFKWSQVSDLLSHSVFLGIRNKATSSKTRMDTSHHVIWKCYFEFGKVFHTWSGQHLEFPLYPGYLTNVTATHKKCLYNDYYSKKTCNSYKTHTLKHRSSLSRSLNFIISELLQEAGGAVGSPAETSVAVVAWRCLSFIRGFLCTGPILCLWADRDLWLWGLQHGLLLIPHSPVHRSFDRVF